MNVGKMKKVLNKLLKQLNEMDPVVEVSDIILNVDGYYGDPIPLKVFDMEVEEFEDESDGDKLKAALQISYK